MKKEIEKIFSYLSELYKDVIDPNGVNYIDVNLGKIAESLGLDHLKKQLGPAGAIIPLKRHLDGMKVLIDGRTFVKYSQFDSGIAAPDYVARHSESTKKPYISHESMILNFA